MPNQNTTSEAGDEYECDECGTVFHASQDEATPLSECPNCKSDNASPLNG
jgi:predicted Zn-ribbon and HTH transcriptional regulator